MALEIGLQVYSVREAMAKDLLGTLKKVAEIGYSQVEFANHHADDDYGIGHGVDAVTVKAALDDFGLGVIANHVGPIHKDNIEQIAEYNKILGNDVIVEGIGFWTNRDEVLAFAEALNNKGQFLKQYGMEFYYHNHFMEHQEFQGESVFETLISHTDPELVKFEIDMYWSFRAGVEHPEEFVASLGNRCTLVHLKDFPANAEPANVYEKLGKDAVIDMEVFKTFTGPECFTEIGSGIIDCKGIVKSMNENPNVTCLIVEQDRSSLTEIESITITMKNINNIMKSL